MNHLPPDPPEPSQYPASNLERVVSGVCANPRYRQIAPDLVKRIAGQELAKGRRIKDAVKAVRSKLHQVGGAYLETPVDFRRLTAELDGLPVDFASPELRAFCRKAMSLHASTRERLPDLDSFYQRTLQSIAPVESILDLACGFNPLSLPWMPLAEGGSYSACDIFQDAIGFTGHFLARSRIRGEAFVCDLVQTVPQQPVQLALLLKTLPCLEQLDKDIAPRLLANIRAENLLVSFPARSLGGRAKGMVRTYEERFLSLVQGSPWEISQRILFENELTYLLRHPRMGYD